MKTLGNESMTNFPNCARKTVAKMANEKRLIDANAFLSSMIKRFKCVPLIGRNDYDCESLKQMLIETPTVDALIPPCKPWDKVWIICKTLDEVNGGLKKTICEGEIIKLSYNGFTTPMEWLDYRWDSPLVGQTASHDRIDLCLGKSLFFTRKEAEAALAKMDGDGNG